MIILQLNKKSRFYRLLQEVKCACLISDPHWLTEVNYAQAHRCLVVKHAIMAVWVYCFLHHRGFEVRGYEHLPDEWQQPTSQRQLLTFIEKNSLKKKVIFVYPRCVYSWSPRKLPTISALLFFLLTTKNARHLLCDRL